MNNPSPRMPPGIVITLMVATIGFMSAGDLWLTHSNSIGGIEQGCDAASGSNTVPSARCKALKAQNSWLTTGQCTNNKGVIMGDAYCSFIVRKMETSAPQALTNVRERPQS